MTNRRKNRGGAADAEAAPPTTVGDATTTTTTAPDSATAATASSPVVAETLLIGQIPMSVPLRNTIYNGIFTAIAAVVLRMSFTMRISTVQKYGPLLHNSDPWFNYRAAEYMSTHGWSAFFSWFDYMSWYPLGRPVGSTTYPGLQFTAVAIHRTLAAIGIDMSFNDVCVMMPACLSLVSCALAALLAHEMTGSVAVCSLTTIFFSVVPAHLMRSMAGEFDNECIAIPAMLLTFYVWVRSLRTPRSWPIGVATGLAYGYLAASWGGYIFVLNMVALHAGVSSVVDYARNTYNPALLRAYALFYVVGTAIATRVPPVGMSPFKSLEQLGALVVLVFLAAQAVCEVQRSRHNVLRFSKEGLALLIRTYAAFFVGIVAVAAVAPAGFFKPLSLQATALVSSWSQTGNTLVDVLMAQDQSSLVTAWQLLLFPFFCWMVGLSTFLSELVEHFSYAKTFMVLYGATGLYFASQSVRMLAVVAPAACVFTALLFRWVMEYFLETLFWPALPEEPPADSDQRPLTAEEAEEAEAKQKRRVEAHAAKHSKRVMLRMLPLTVLFFLFRISGFVEDVSSIAHELEAPGVVFQGASENQQQGAETTVFYDYYAGYRWLRDNTPQDARVLAWWDYGYQINGIGNRTSLADGNAWNPEHVATVSKMLTSPVAEAHSLLRHMADYVLIFAGNMYFSDLQRSPLMARIGNSVYRDICPNDPLCARFVFQKKQKPAGTAGSRRGRHASALELDDEVEPEKVEYEPSPLMAKSLIHQLHFSGIKKGVAVEAHQFEHVHTTANGLMRIFKVTNVSEESKRWTAEPANRVCSPPGSWICPGQYPPAPEIQEMLAHRHTNFREVIDAIREREREQELNKA